MDIQDFSVEPQIKYFQPVETIKAGEVVYKKKQTTTSELAAMLQNHNKTGADWKFPIRIKRSKQ